MTALRTLSAESTTQRRQHAEDIESLRQRFERQAAENETLRRQFERLDGQMTRLARTTGRSPRRCAGAGPDAPARPDPRSGSEPLK